MADLQRERKLSWTYSHDSQLLPLPISTETQVLARDTETHKLESASGSNLKLKEV